MLAEEKKDMKQEKGKAPAPEAKQAPEAKKAPPAKKKELVSITRIAGKDLRGDLPLSRAISSIKGIGHSMGRVLSDIISRELSVDLSKNLGDFSEEQIKSIESVIEHPEKYNLPKFLLNRRKDRTTGQDSHLIGSDLSFATKQDIQHQVDTYTWVGYRHAYGQKVRGQRTRTTGRSGMAVGVLRKAVLAKAGAAAAAGQAGAQGAAAGPAAPGVAPGKAGPAPAAGAKGPSPAAAPGGKGAAPAAGPAPAGKEKAPAKEQKK